MHYKQWQEVVLSGVLGPVLVSTHATITARAAAAAPTINLGPAKSYHGTAVCVVSSALILHWLDCLQD